MATALTVQPIVIAGITPTYAVADATGNLFLNDGDTYLEVINSSGANTYTLTFTTPATYGGVAVTEITATVGTSVTRKIGPFSPKVYNNSAAQVSVTYSGTPGDVAATDLTVGAFTCARVDV